MKSNLKLIVLNLLAKESLTGYNLIKKIHNMTGWKPSYGSVYPLLSHALKHGLIKQKKDGRKKIYSITTKGKECLSAHAKKRDELMAGMIAHLKAMKIYYPCNSRKNHLDYIIELLYTTIKKDSMSFMCIMDEVSGFKSAILGLAAKNRIVKNKERINKILKKARQSLESLS